MTTTALGGAAVFALTLALLAGAAFIVHAYFVLGVQVHENHLYLAVPLLAAGAANCGRSSTR